MFRACNQAQVHLAFAPRPAENYAHTVLRGVAALLVVGSHAIRQPEDLDPGLGSFLQSSYLFVDLFFLLSGFIMIETYAVRLRTAVSWVEVMGFLRKRVIKILPNYYFWLLLGMAVFLMTERYSTGQMLPISCLGPSLLNHLLMVQHFAETCALFNIPLWSIVTEMFVYLVFPVLVLALRVWWIAAIAALALYAGLFATHDTIDLIEGGGSLVRTLCGFVMGCAIALLHHNVPDQILCTAQLPILLGLVLAVVWQAEVLAIMTMALLVLMTSRNIGPLWYVARWPGFYVLGRASFSIYLAHIPTLAFLVLLTAKVEVETSLPLLTDWHFFVPISLVMCGAVGVAGYLLIERSFEIWFRPAPSAGKTSR